MFDYYNHDFTLVVDNDDNDDYDDNDFVFVIPIFIVAVIV